MRILMNYCIVLLVYLAFVVRLSSSILSKMNSSNFVYVEDLIPSIVTNLRYAGSNNFVGRPFKGYANAKKAILTKQATLALEKAQAIFQKDGFSIVIYDGYRPQKAVDNLLDWSLDEADQEQKEYFYPAIEKAILFGRYIALRSGHTRGSTVDLTIIKKGSSLHPIQPVSRNFSGLEFWYLDDGTVDMGSSFDLFSPISHIDYEFLNEEQKKNRIYLRNVLESCGFKSVNHEWWHFTLKDEPYPETYWDFDVE